MPVIGAPLWVSSSQGSTLPPDSPVPPKWQSSRPPVDDDDDDVVAPPLVELVVPPALVVPPPLVPLPPVSSPLLPPELELEVAAEVEAPLVDPALVDPSSPAQPARARVTPRRRG